MAVVVVTASSSSSLAAAPVARANLGLPAAVAGALLRNDSPLKKVNDALLGVLVRVVPLLFPLIRAVPLRLRHAALILAWKLWLSLHKALPTSLVRRGLSNTLSIEAHAVSNLLWWVRLAPPTLELARFGLSEIHMVYPPSQGLVVEDVNEPEIGVRGCYLRLGLPSHRGQGSPPRPTLLWFFGGAYIGGTARGNVGIAERYGRLLGCDVFVHEMRLAPEASLEEIFTDGCRAYEWLVSRVPPEKVIVLGISSGGGCATRVLQLARADEATRKTYFAMPDKGPLPMPAGCVLLGPFVSYLKELPRSMTENAKLDLIVTPRVIDLVSDYMPGMCGGEGEPRRLASPLFNSFSGLCPLLVSASRHETCWDEDQDLARKAQAAGVDVTLRDSPYLCHVFQLTAAFLPEAQKEELVIRDWVREKGGPAWNGAT